MKENLLHLQLMIASYHQNPARPQGRERVQHTCEIPPCRIHLPIIESGIYFILVHLINGGHQLLLPFQSSKPGS